MPLHIPPREALGKDRELYDIVRQIVLQSTPLTEVFTSTRNGLAPASGGGSLTFMRADGAWAVPPGLGDLSGSGTATQVPFFTGTKALSSDPGLLWNNTTKALSSKFLDTGGIVYNVKSETFGAKGDAVLASGAMLTGSTTLTGVGFVPGDVGKVITVQGASGTSLANNGTFTAASKVVTGVGGAPAAGSLVGQTIQVGAFYAEIAYNTTTTIYLMSAWGGAVGVQAFKVHGTLVTTIAAYVGPTQVTLTAGNSAGEDVAARRLFYGTDDSNAFDAALTACNGVGGAHVVVPAGLYMIGDNALTLGNGVTIEGPGNQGAGGNPGAWLIFTRATGTCLDLNGVGNIVHGCGIRPENSAYASSVVDLSTDGTAMAVLSHCLFDLQGAGSATAVILNNYDSIEHVIENCDFLAGAIGVRGIGNVVTIRNCQFRGYTEVPIKDPGECWIVDECTFEQGAYDQACAVLGTVACKAFRFLGNWCGDSTFQGTGQAWVTLYAGGGIGIENNYFGVIPGVSGGQNVRAVWFNNSALHGVSVSENYIDFGTQAGCVGIDANSLAHAGLLLQRNYIVAPTKITGIGSLNGAEGIRSGNCARNYQLLATAQNLPNNVQTAVWLDNPTPPFNRGPMWAAGSNTRLTVPTAGAGLYTLIGQVTFDANATGRRDVEIWKNGARIAIERSLPPGGVLDAVVQCAITDLASDADYYELYATQDSGGGLPVIGGADLTWLSAIKVH